MKRRVADLKPVSFEREIERPHGSISAISVGD
jgi:hypothetical protein